MATISTNAIKEIKTTKKVVVKKSLWTKYLEYADSKANEGVLWYLKVILAIPCVFMVFSIFAMAMITPNYVWFVGVCIMLFYANVIAHIGEAKSRFFIPLYHATILVMILIPTITYFLS